MAVIGRADIYLSSCGDGVVICAGTRDSIGYHHVKKRGEGGRGWYYRSFPSPSQLSAQPSQRGREARPAQTD